MKIAIASGKGGTGKTTLSVNLAVFLNENDYGLSGITLVDLDVEEPNSGLFLKGKTLKSEIAYRPVPLWNAEKCTFCGKCTSVCRFNALALLPKTILVFNELCHSCYACSELCPENALPMSDIRMGEVKVIETDEKLVFVEGILDIGQESAVPLIKKVKKLAGQISGDNHLLIFDSPPGTSCPVIEATKDVDYVILITEPTPFGLHDLKLAVETMKELNKKMGVVINRFGIGNDDVEKYCQTEQIDVLGKIPYSREIAECYSNGNLQKNESFVSEMKNIIDKMFLLTSINTK